MERSDWWALAYFQPPWIRVGRCRFPCPPLAVAVRERECVPAQRMRWNDTASCHHHWHQWHCSEGVATMPRCHIATAETSSRILVGLCAPGEYSVVPLSRHVCPGLQRNATRLSGRLWTGRAGPGSQQRHSCWPSSSARSQPVSSCSNVLGGAHL
ncbi:GL25200 [Drosophila persimilis]|uniref:GL25200 n=1 Tax=Drosophila persimilis TaxID=7234 RepID=B4GRH2_DROPE|nr:GL25200 [Drosophila persimilis]